MKFADLHLHTSFSDGTFTPEELVLQAQKNGLSCIALTDHDTVQGCARAAAACAPVLIEFIPGTELTAEHDDTEVHILGYFLDTQNPTLLGEIAKFQAVRKQLRHLRRKWTMRLYLSRFSHISNTAPDRFSMRYFLVQRYYNLYHVRPSHSGDLGQSS